MDLFELIWDASQQRQIDDQEGRLSSTVVNMKVAGERIRALQGRVFRLTAISQVLCDLLVEKLGIPPEDLKAAIELRLKEGEPDSENCPSCNHPTHPGRRACLYCGYVLASSSTSPVSSS